jgi:predicted DNA-binding transcriptional regulator AlpA
MTKQKTLSSAVELPSARDEAPDFEQEKAVPATVGLAEAALILGIHKSTAWAFVQAGTFPVPVVRVGTRIRVVKVHIQQFLETGEPVTFGTATAKPVAFESMACEANAS